MEKKNPMGLIILVVYLFLLIASQWPLSIYKLSQIPAVLDFVRGHYEFITQHAFLKSAFITLPLEYFRAILIIFIMPVGTVFILKRKNWARKTISLGCLFLLLHAILHFVRNYPDIVSWDMQKHTPGVQRANALIENYTNMHMSENIEIMLIQYTLISVLCILLPIYYLNRPEIKSQFK